MSNTTQTRHWFEAKEDLGDDYITVLDGDSLQNLQQRILRGLVEEDAVPSKVNTISLHRAEATGELDDKGEPIFGPSIVVADFYPLSGFDLPDIKASQFNT